MRDAVAGSAFMLVPLAVVLLGGCGEAPPAEASEPTLDEVRAATARYADVNVALADGYILDPTKSCETAEMLGHPASHGAMGVHYFRPDLLGITGPPDPRVSGTGTHTDFLQPSVLIYEPQAGGGMELIAVENLAFKAAWDAAGNTAPPSFHGLDYDYMWDDPDTELDEAHGFEPHYDRHVWVHRENPNGMFAQLNPTVTCEHMGDGSQAPGAEPPAVEVEA